MPPVARLVLASRSPRRRALLAQIGVTFDVLPVDILERRAAAESPREYVERVALAKARTALARLPAAAATCVLGADTEVVLDGDVFGKPADDAAAAAMLERLAGRCHQVISAVWLLDGDCESAATAVTTVRMAALDASLIGRYVASGEPRGKAGAYAIQGRAAAFIERIEGSYSAVMGLPLFETAGLLRARGLL